VRQKSPKMTDQITNLSRQWFSDRPARNRENPTVERNSLTATARYSAGSWIVDHVIVNCNGQTTYDSNTALQVQQLRT